MVSTLKELVRNRPTNDLYFECRRCGRTVAARARTCPGCGAQDIACYALR